MKHGYRQWPFFCGQSMSMAKFPRKLQDSDLVFIVKTPFGVLVIDRIAIKTSGSES
jgi:hypothetical protein